MKAMRQQFKGWNAVSQELCAIARGDHLELNDGQRASLLAIAARIAQNGVIIADEVGMGKTRIAAAVAKSVIAVGGRVAILVPSGLGFQWADELRKADVEVPPVLRSLNAYLNAWDMGSGHSRAQKVWGEHEALLISHAFCNWSLKGTTKTHWRWALLPETLAHWRAKTSDSKRMPRGYRNNAKLLDPRVTAAASWIAENSAHLPSELVDDPSLDAWGRESPLLDPSNYGRETVFRRALEKVVGLGLGRFDLVIIDEAHKSRGQESGLNRLLERLIFQADQGRRVAMTATPVELDAEQWRQTLSRIEVDVPSTSDAISAYSDAVAKVRCCPSDESVRETYKEAAKKFKEFLSRYLLRRDKREDPWIRAFHERSGEMIHAYRREREICVNTSTLTPDWKRVVCAAEALAFVTSQADDSAAKLKRLRLTLGNGHGLATLIDTPQERDNASDIEQSMDHSASSSPLERDDQDLAMLDKRLQRVQWWQGIAIKPFVGSVSALFDHPAILAAVRAIEEVCQEGEKVLVFGRFTRPLQALVRLLSAREMLRSIDGQRPWPKSKVHENEWAAVEAAHRHLMRPGELDRGALDQQLADQYKRLEQQRRGIRENLISGIEEGLGKVQATDRVRVLFDIFKNEVSSVPEHGKGSDDHSVAVIARAIQELIESAMESPSPTDLAAAFVDLIHAASDRDKGDADEDGDLDELSAAALWQDLVDRLREEYNRPEGGFARLMDGDAKPHTRRLLQLAFNRRHGYPKVLVAQSAVGREGLNLHKACRTVVLLHPEWNPGVVEQQIGRVDRIGSLWERKVEEALNGDSSNDGLPRIEIRPVIFQGTYDEKNWQVLRERWDDLRAQLHGIVISPRVADGFGDLKSTIGEINDAAPNFSPTACN
ncbi:helicase-related protein [Ralstonia flatus]|nr:helicase-related protein [Ralstonia sp. LMG 32965]